MAVKQKLPRGVTEIRDGKHESKPYRVEHRGKRGFFATAAEAINEKNRLKSMEAEHGTAAIQYSRQAHSEYDQARTVLRQSNLKVSLVDVAHFYAKHHARKHNAPKTVAEGITMFMDRKGDLKRSSRHLADLKSRLKRFEASFGPFDMTAISRNEVEDWLHGLNLSARSIRNFHNTLANFFNYATRRGWVGTNPIETLTTEDLPTISSVQKEILTVSQVKGFMAYLEDHHPEYCLWAAIKIFLGIRTAEAERFKANWIDHRQKRVLIPGWIQSESGQHIQGSKTQDDWVIFDVEPAFWKWADKYKDIDFPTARPWTRILADMGERGIIDHWPANATRRSFTTYHISLYRDAPRTSLILRHQNPRRLMKNYLALMVPKNVAKKYFQITPQR